MLVTKSVIDKIVHAYKRIGRKSINGDTKTRALKLYKALKKVLAKYPAIPQHVDDADVPRLKKIILDEIEGLCCNYELQGVVETLFSVLSELDAAQ